MIWQKFEKIVSALLTRFRSGDPMGGFSGEFRRQTATGTTFENRLIGLRDPLSLMLNMFNKKFRKEELNYEKPCQIKWNLFSGYPLIT